MAHHYNESDYAEDNRRTKRRDNIYNQLKDKKLSEFTVKELPLVLMLLRYYRNPHYGGIYDSDMDEMEEKLIK